MSSTPVNTASSSCRKRKRTLTHKHTHTLAVVAVLSRCTQLCENLHRTNKQTSGRRSFKSKRKQGWKALAKNVNSYCWLCATNKYPTRSFACLLSFDKIDTARKFCLPQFLTSLNTQADLIYTLPHFHRVCRVASKRNADALPRGT